jgi:hypothetical protein
LSFRSSHRLSILSSSSSPSSQKHALPRRRHSH